MEETVFSVHKRQNEQDPKRDFFITLWKITEWQNIHQMQIAYSSVSAFWNSARVSEIFPSRGKKVNLDTELEAHFLALVCSIISFWGPTPLSLISHPSFGVWKTGQKITLSFPGSTGWVAGYLIKKITGTGSYLAKQHCYSLRHDEGRDFSGQINKCHQEAQKIWTGKQRPWSQLQKSDYIFLFCEDQHRSPSK